jgi:hypothetical protein
VNMRPGDRYVPQPDLGIRTFDRRRRCRTYRRVKREDAERTKVVVRDDLVLRIDLASGIALVKVREGEELSGENKEGAQQRNRLCAPANDPPGISPPRNHRTIIIIARALRRYPPA